MEKALNVMTIALAAAAVLQIAVVNFMMRGANSVGLMKTVDFSAMQNAFNLMPFLF